MEVEVRMNTGEGGVLLSPWLCWDARNGRGRHLIRIRGNLPRMVDDCMLDQATFHAVMRSGIKRHPQGNHVDLDR